MLLPRVAGGFFGRLGHASGPFRAVECEDFIKSGDNLMRAQTLEMVKISTRSTTRSPELIRSRQIVRQGQRGLFSTIEADFCQDASIHLTHLTSRSSTYDLHWRSRDGPPRF